MCLVEEILGASCRSRNSFAQTLSTFGGRMEQWPELPGLLHAQ